MTTKRPPHRPPAPGPLPDADVPPSDEAMPSAAESPGDASETGEEHEEDPYDKLWDPDMDTRPERIRKTRARREFRPKGGAPGRGRKREGP